MLTLAQALANVSTPLQLKNRFSTGLGQLDILLSDPHSNESVGGLARGSTVEISAPTGCGKTAVGLSLVCDALRRGHRVVWIATNGSAMPLDRLKQQKGFSESHLGCFRQIFIRSLSQLFVLCQVRPKSPAHHVTSPRSVGSSDKPQGQDSTTLHASRETGSNPSGSSDLASFGPSLVIVEDIYTLISRASSGSTSALQEQRRAFCITKLMQALSQFSNACSCATLVLSGCIPRYVSSSDSDMLTAHSQHYQYRKLVPFTGYGAWEKWLCNRIVLMRLSPLTIAATDSRQRLMYMNIMSHGLVLDTSHSPEPDVVPFSQVAGEAHELPAANTNIDTNATIHHKDGTLSHTSQLSEHGSSNSQTSTHNSPPPSPPDISYDADKHHNNSQELPSHSSRASTPPRIKRRASHDSDTGLRTFQKLKTIEVDALTKNQKPMQPEMSMSLSLVHNEGDTPCTPPPFHPSPDPPHDLPDPKTPPDIVPDSQPNSQPSWTSLSP